MTIMLSLYRGDFVTKRETIASNKYHAKVYDSIRILTHKGDRERLHSVVRDKGHDSINDMILAALEDYTGLEGLRLKGDKPHEMD